MFIINGEVFYKVAENYKYSLLEVILYNGEQVKKIIVDDTDYQYGDGLISHEFTLDELEKFRFAPINEEFRIKWLHSKNMLVVGDKILIYKGRKAKNEIGVIEKIFDYRDKYNRFLAEYTILRLENNTTIAININNLKLIEG